MATVNGPNDVAYLPPVSRFDPPIVPVGGTQTFKWDLLSQLIQFPKPATTSASGGGAVEAVVKYQVSDATGNFRGAKIQEVPLLSRAAKGGKPVAHSWTFKNPNVDGKNHSQVQYWVEARDEKGNPSVAHTPLKFTLAPSKQK